MINIPDLRFQMDGKRKLLLAGKLYIEQYILQRTTQCRQVLPMLYVQNVVHRQGVIIILQKAVTRLQIFDSLHRGFSIKSWAVISTKLTATKLAAAEFLFSSSPWIWMAWHCGRSHTNECIT
jgi:hypothetical protein